MAGEPKKKHAKSKTRTRRSAIKLEPIGLIICQNCGRFKRPHMVCLGCGFYR